MTATISARQLTKSFGQGPLAVNAVREVDLDIEAGEIVLIMGPSGSGKTTLLMMLGAMTRPTSGTISIDGIDIGAAPERRLPAFRARHLGFVFQDFNLIGALTAAENVELVCNLAGITGRHAAERARALLGRVGLSERLHHRPDQLSGGEKQRVAVARALANEPTVILADEPTANLDSSHGRDIGRLLRQLALDDRVSIVIVSHDERLREIAHRTLWLADGQIRTLDAMATDPVCAMSVQPGDTTPHYQHGDATYWFCALSCRDEFVSSPERFLATLHDRRTPGAQPPRASMRSIDR